MTQIKFLESRTVLDAQGRVEQQFVKDQVYDLPPVSAERWIRRRVAVELEQKKPLYNPLQTTAEMQAAFGEQLDAGKVKPETLGAGEEVTKTTLAPAATVPSPPARATRAPSGPLPSAEAGQAGLTPTAPAKEALTETTVEDAAAAPDTPAGNRTKATTGPTTPPPKK